MRAAGETLLGRAKVQNISERSALPIYSDGLGYVAGDQLKAAREMGVPIVGVGLLFQQGDLRQLIDRMDRDRRCSRTTIPDNCLCLDNISSGGI